MKKQSTGKKTRSERKLDKSMREISRIKASAVFGAYLNEMVGKEITHKDRSYVIQRDGSYRRITEKDGVIRNSLNYK